MRPPRNSTLFPYTPLSRSGQAAEETDDAARRDRARADVEDVTFLYLRDGHLAYPVRRFGRERLGQARAEILDRRNEHEVDRKSTRLNSSHLVISYAVFCLT